MTVAVPADSASRWAVSSSGNDVTARTTANNVTAAMWAESFSAGNVTCIINNPLGLNKEIKLHQRQQNKKLSCRKEAVWCFVSVSTIPPVESFIITYRYFGFIFTNARVRFSVCLSVSTCARLLKTACVDFDEMLRVDRCRDMGRARSGS